MNRNWDGAARVSRSHSAYDVGLAGKSQVDGAHVRPRNNRIASGTETAHPGNQDGGDIEAPRCPCRRARTSGIPRGHYQRIVEGIAICRLKWWNVVKTEIALGVCIGLLEDDE